MNGQAPKLGAGSELAKSNLLLGRDVDRGSTLGAFRRCADMKADGIKPSIVTYERLLLLCARNKAMTDAWAIFEDMLCMDIQPDREIFHHLLEVSWPLQLNNLTESTYSFYIVGVSFLWHSRSMGRHGYDVTARHISQPDYLRNPHPSITRF